MKISTLKEKRMGLGIALGALLAVAITIKFLFSTFMMTCLRDEAGA